MRAELSHSNQQPLLNSRIHDRVITHVSGLIPHQELQTEISNRILLNLLQEKNGLSNIDAWIERKTCQYLELCMQELWQSAYKHARQLNLEQEEAEDLAQITIIALLKNKEPIQYPRAWIRATVSNQANFLIRKKVQSRELKHQLTLEQALPAPSTQFDEDLDEKLSLTMLKKLLSKEDFNALKTMRSYTSLKAYATDKGIRYNNARKHKHQIITNLRAKFYTAQGWTATRAILDYSLLQNLGRFVEVITQHAVKNDFSSIYHYASSKVLPDLKASLSGFSEVSKWEVALSKKFDYDLCLLDARDPAQPLAAFISISLNKANYIRIKQCSRAAAVHRIPVAKLGPLPTDKGRCLLSLDQILSYLN